MQTTIIIILVFFLMLSIALNIWIVWTLLKSYTDLETENQKRQWEGLNYGN